MILQRSASLAREHGDVKVLRPGMKFVNGFHDLIQTEFGIGIEQKNPLWSRSVGSPQPGLHPYKAHFFVVQERTAARQQDSQENRALAAVSSGRVYDMGKREIVPVTRV